MPILRERERREREREKREREREEREREVRESQEIEREREERESQREIEMFSTTLYSIITESLQQTKHIYKTQKRCAKDQSLL